MPFVEALGTSNARIIAYPGETGVALQHLGPLIGRAAHALVWPEIVSWIHSRYRAQPRSGAAA
jgi:polyhydroxyalkanoate synthase